jgi:UPF0755 protein
MKFFITKILVTLFALLLSLGMGAAYVAYDKFQTPSANAAEKIIEIPKGVGTLAIADQLHAEGIVSDAYVFILASKILPPKGTLKAGEYAFASAMSMHDVVGQLKQGSIYKRQFTIPEGLTSFEIVERLKSVPNMTVDPIDVPAEGSLLPDTYQYRRDEKLSNKINQMHSALQVFVDQEWPLRDADLPFQTIEQALVLASIVEKETGVSSERKRIAGVFVNRLRQGIPLQSDPTVIYALTKGHPKNDGQGPLGRRIYSKDLTVDSPYNTYKNKGLPPGPIANPGREAILAVLHPETHDFLYFVADGSGGHVFASTLEAHNQNVANWRKLRRNMDGSGQDQEKD